MKTTKPIERQRALLRKRGLNWQDYRVIRELYGSVWFINIHTRKILIVNKHN